MRRVAAFVVVRIAFSVLLCLAGGKCAAADGGLAIDADYPGGNIIVDGIDGERVSVRQDLRDTEGWWFYWNFRVRGAAGRTLRFHFAGRSPIGLAGPAVSLDGGLSWTWLGAESVEGSGFLYTFSSSEEEVRFSFAPPYQERDLRRFLEAAMPGGGIIAEEFARTKADRVVRRLRLGRLDGEAEHKILVVCRHHACESVASYVLEGLMEQILREGADGQWYAEKAEVMVIPFMDPDGVERGDQGKNRRPHDHNKDYQGESIYASVRQLRREIPAWSGGRLAVALDLHCPYKAGDRIFFVGRPDPNMVREQEALCGAFGEVASGRHRVLEILPFGTSWNTNRNSATFSNWAAGIEGIRLASTLEVAYARAGGEAVTPESARALGRDLAKALRRYVEGFSSGS